MRIFPFQTFVTGTMLAVASLPVPANASDAATSAVAQVPLRGDERECLATAIAYEAGYEPLDGRRAVADVILNRTRSGHHPATICGVVYEGSARRTGCQFTFTCDGSLRRRLPDRVIDEARRVADEALSGTNASQIGGAINYHA
ncbi:MAG: cell wall hydrolase, partial [Novosphingobium sp.]